MTASQKLVFPWQMNEADAGFFFLGQRPSCNVAMVMIAVLPSRVPYEEMLEELLGASQHVSRFLDRLQPAPLGVGPPTWVPVDPLRPREQIREVVLPTGASWDDALQAVDELQSSDFLPGSPPWEIVQVTGCPNDEALFAMKVHHALSDGTALSLLFAKAFGRSFLEQAGIEIEAVSERPPRTSPIRLALTNRARAVRGWARRARRQLPDLLLRPETRRRELDALRNLVWPRYRQPADSFGASRRLSGFRVPAEIWNREAEARGGSANDLYLAVVARAMWTRFPDWDLDAMPLKIVMPVNIREDGVQDGGNVTGVSVVELDGDSRHLDDLGEVRLRTSEAKVEAHRSESSMVGELINLLPGRLRGALQYREFATRDVVATNVPVPIPGELCGVPLEAMFMVAPSIGTAASFSLTTYRDDVQLAVNVDPTIVPGGLDAEVAGVLGALFDEPVESLRDGTVPGRSAPTAT